MWYAAIIAFALLLAWLSHVCAIKAIYCGLCAKDRGVCFAYTISIFPMPAIHCRPLLPYTLHVHWHWKTNSWDYLNSVMQLSLLKVSHKRIFSDAWFSIVVLSSRTILVSLVLDLSFLVSDGSHSTFSTRLEKCTSRGLWQS